MTTMKTDREINRMVYDIMKGDNYDAYLKALKEVLQKEDLYSICKVKVEKAVEKYKNYHDIIDPFGLDKIILQKILINKIPSYMLKPLDIGFFSNLTTLDNDSILRYSLVLQMDDKELYYFIDSLYRSLVCVYPFQFRSASSIQKIKDGIYTKYIANIIPDNTNNTLSYYIVSMDKELEYSYVRYLFATFIMSALKFNRKMYDKAVRDAIVNVRKNFPGYRKNVYFYKSLKGLYLLGFNRCIAWVLYFFKSQK